jgi:hypothetical protein
MNERDRPASTGDGGAEQEGAALTTCAERSEPRPTHQMLDAKTRAALVAMGAHQHTRPLAFPIPNHTDGIVMSELMVAAGAMEIQICTDMNYYSAVMLAKQVYAAMKRLVC